MEDLIIELADQLLEKSETYGEAIRLCQQIEHEIKLRAYEQHTERG
ncbi:hypothetical protein [Streptococcus sp. S784/96/1]|nr:hypothetical protein [Streptococcus sp. S784/96/1]